MSYGQHRGPIVPDGWDGELCQDCGHNVYYVDVCERGNTPGERAKQAAWRTWQEKARAEFEKYWAEFGGI